MELDGLAFSFHHAFYLQKFLGVKGKGRPRREGAGGSGTPTPFLRRGFLRLHEPSSF